MPSHDLRNEISRVLGMDRPQDIVDGVKQAVIGELAQLDPSVEITRTDYFNHSFAPDIVLSWPNPRKKGKTEERDVFLRFSLLDARAAQDIEFLGPGGPVLLSLDSQENDQELTSQMAEEVGRAPSLLLTNVPTIDDIAEPATSGSVDDSSRPGVPLLGLFRENIVRDGRGLLVFDAQDQAWGLSTAEPEIGSPGQFELFADEVSRRFRESAARRLRRAAEIIRIALTRNAEAREERLSGLTGTLEKAELRTLLPFLLSNPDVTQDPRFWRHLGRMMTLGQLEEIQGNLGERDLTPLARASLDQWYATKSAITFAAGDDENMPAESSGWHISSGMLCLQIGTLKVYVTTDGRKARWRDSSLLARWDELSPVLRQFDVAAIELQGAVRSVRVSADDGGNVYRDAEAIQDRIEDTFRVKAVEIRPTNEESEPIEVDFRRLSATGREVPLAELVRISIDLLGYRFPPSPADRERLVSS